MVSFDIDGQLLNVPVRPQLTANNGEVLAEAAAQGMGHHQSAGFYCRRLAGQRPAGGDFARLCHAPAGVYALLPGNKQIPHRVRVLLEFWPSGWDEARTG